MDGKWEVLGVEDIYESNWTKLQVAELELPDKTKIKHDVITTPLGAGWASTVASVAGKGTLLIWRHRFITDQWTWELPAGSIEARELPKKAAEREMLEETGWKPGNLKPLLKFQPLNGIMDHQCHGFITDTATYEGPARDTNEASDIAWLSTAEIDALVERGDVADGPTLTLLLYAMRKGLLVD